MGNHLNNANAQIHEGQPSLDWIRQENTFLNIGQTLPTSLKELKAISRRQKVLHWLEAHVPRQPETLAKDNEDGGNNIDKEQSHEILEDDIICPVPSEKWGDSSQSQDSQDMSEEYSDQEWFQSEEDESTMTSGETTTDCNPQSASPALAAPTGTKQEPATSPSRASPQQGHTGSISTSTGHALPTSSWDVSSVPGVQSGVCLLSSQSLGSSHIHVLVQQPQQSLFRRALRAVRRAFLGTPSPQEQQCPTPSTRQLPGHGHSEPQQRPRRE